MKNTKLNNLECTIFFSLAVLIPIFLIMESPSNSALLRIIIITAVSALLFVFTRMEENNLAKLLLEFLNMLLLTANKIKTSGDIIRGVPVYNLPEIPTVNRISLGIFSVGILFIIGVYFFLFWEVFDSAKRLKKYTKQDAPKIVKIEPDLILLLMVLYSLSLIAISVSKPIYDSLVNKQFDYAGLQDYLFMALMEGCLSLMPLTFFYIAVLQDLRPEASKHGNFLITENKTIVKYKGKTKKIYVPKDFNIYLTDTFLECDDSYEIWFEEGTLEVPPLKFNKSIPEIHYPSSLQNIREYSLFIKDQNPFDNSCTVKNLLKNPVFQIFDGCMVNTKTQTLLFVIEHTKNEFKIPECVNKIGRYAFDDLLLGKCYKLRRNPEYQVEEFLALNNKYNSFSNGSGKEYLLNEGATVLHRIQLERIYLHKKIEFIDPDAFELATGLREVYVPEEAEYDLAEMISTRPYIKYLGKGKKITHRMIERLLQIHSKIKSGCFPNSKQLAYDLETSEPTINRDIEYLRDSRGAPIEYDYVNRGYYYTEDYDLFFDK